MARSLKKGPFVDDHLMEKVESQNEAGTKKVYENNKFNDGNPRQKLYIHESDLASVNLSKDILSAQ